MSDQVTDFKEKKQVVYQRIEFCGFCSNMATNPCKGCESKFIEVEDESSILADSSPSPAAEPTL